MREDGIGRVLVASLHQGIGDLLPNRLPFYENWLHAEGLREGSIGLAPLNAVLSFLRQEGAPYQQVMARAGEYAADWTVEAMSPVRRGLVRGTPAWLRVRLLLGLARRLVRATYQGSSAISRLRHGRARIDLRASVFCTVREPVPHPLCGFYAAAFSQLLVRFDISGRVEVESCRGTGKPTCTLVVALSRSNDDVGTEVG